MYRRRFKCYGWNADKQKSKFHLCHINPSQGKDTVGLLHHQNLFIGGSLANQVYGATEVQGAGLCIKRSSLKTKWLVDKDASDKAVLTKVQKYLGTKLVEYAKQNPIRKSQRFGLAKKIKTEFPKCEVPLPELERMGMTALRKLYASLQEQELYTLSLTARRTLVVYVEELERFAEQCQGPAKSSDYKFTADAVRCVSLWLMSQKDQGGFDSIGGFVYGSYFYPLRLKPEQDGSDLRDFAAFQAFAVLQGAKPDRQMITNTLRKYLELTTLDHHDSRSDHNANWLDNAPWIVEDLEIFTVQTELNKQALNNVGLVDAEFLYWWLESKKESLQVASFYDDASFTECRGLNDYPDHYYQVEDDYVPSPPASPWDDPNYLPF
ncbi:hypothetical protein UF78_13875 [Stutzerimonas stutzeri]|uniref:Uncharacterized protein n=1 Tax=Stutzerimonas stutzeri TaxID=316 RepID=A0A0D9AJR2_STUST|nr:hypothetical protein UF78_13875 [Stutzerimonas stutzeri]